MKWQAKLTKEEMSHLRKVVGVRTLAGVKRNTIGQNHMRHKSPEPINEPCWDCKNIARKLGLFVFGDA